MNPVRIPSGLGASWRPELALLIERRQDLTFCEVIPENLDPKCLRGRAPLPRPLAQLKERGVVLIPHGISLSIGSARPPDQERIDRLARAAEIFEAPLVSEHLAFVRSESLEAGHLLPLPMNDQSLSILLENIRAVQNTLPVPLALENISRLFQWPEDAYEEADFLGRVVEESGTSLLLDIANVYANATNFDLDPSEFLNELPWRRVAYVHVGGGIQKEDFYHDTHRHPVPPEIYDWLDRLAPSLPGVLFERDDGAIPPDQWNGVLDRLAQCLRAPHPTHPT